MIRYDIFNQALYEKDINDTFEKILKEKNEKITGYYDLPYDSVNLLKNIKETEKYDTVIIIGIGGSSLGAKAVYDALEYKLDKKMIFLDNPDPIDVDHKLKNIDFAKSAFFVISKSGKTVETISLFKIVSNYFKIDLKKNKNIFIITDKNSPLEKFAKLHNIKIYNIPANVGGRFSVLSAVGIIPLTLAGVNTKNVLTGAQNFLNSFFEKKESHLLQKAAFYAKNREKYNITVVFAYSNLLEGFTKWFVQLWGESLGKIDANGNHVGLTPAGHIGSVDQHSFLQLIMQGPRDKTVTFIKVENFEKNIKIPNLNLEYLKSTDFINSHTLNTLINKECDATKEAIISQKIPADEIVLDRLDEESIGELIIYFELLTSAVGILLDINTYDQPGVELGKKILKKYF